MSKLEELRQHIQNTLGSYDTVDFRNIWLAILLLHETVEEMAARQPVEAYFWLGNGAE